MTTREVEKFGTSLRSFKERFELDAGVVKEVFTYVQRVTEEETRQHHLAEVVAFFPESLMHVQCRKCVADRMCWRGHAQGFLCAAFWMGHGDHPDVRARVERLQALTEESEVLERIAQGDFYDLLALCFLWQVNLHIIPMVTNDNVRKLLFGMVEKMKNPSIYQLTFVENTFIFSSSENTAAIVEGAIPNGESNYRDSTTTQESVSCGRSGGGSTEAGSSTEDGSGGVGKIES